VRSSLAGIAAAAGEIAGRQLRVELRVESPAGPRPAEGAASGAAAEGGASDPVAIVERVFRGTRLPPRDQGERNELR
jgi:hypothetical protein